MLASATLVLAAAGATAGPAVPLAGREYAEEPLRRGQAAPAIAAVPPMCRPPSRAIPAPPPAHRPASQDSTPPSAVADLQVHSESMHTILATWGPAVDAESGVADYVFGVGRAPGSPDLQYWQSTGGGLAACGMSPTLWQLVPGDTVYVSVYACNGAGMWGDLAAGGTILRLEPLGRDDAELGIAYAGDWRPSEVDSMQHFLSRMLPIVREIYGPPSRSYTLTLVKNPLYQYTNVFFPAANQVLMYRMYPQLLTHEILHAWRDNVILASDMWWRYDPTLSGFEESFAQGVSYACMNRYVELYPDDPIVPGNSSYGSFYEPDYDFQNTDLLTTTDFWSDWSGTGIFWLRYEMGAAAILKILLEHPTFARDFNREYYRRLEADPDLRTSRQLAVDIVRQVAPEIEGWPAATWVDRQRIFDCRIRTGRKIWVQTQHYPTWGDYFVFQHVFHYETFPNGSEWVHWDDAIGAWRYHALNGSRGQALVRDARGNVVLQKEIVIEPTENPPVVWGFGSAALHLSTDDDTEPWPGGDAARFVLGMHRFGLYWLDLRFGATEVSVPRIMGDTLRATRGVYGSVLNATAGMLWLDQEGAPEPPLQVQDGAFWGLRAWASVPNPRTGTLDSRPGAVRAWFVDASGTVYEDRRTIHLGSWSGSQILLLDTQAMKRHDDLAAPAASPWSFDFGSQAPGSVTDRTLALTNIGRAPLVVDSIATRTSAFRVLAPPAGASVARGDTLWLALHFAPGHVQSYADTLEVFSRSMMPRVAIPLAGSGQASTGAPPGAGVPAVLVLHPNAPNPFNPSTRIRYALPRRAHARLEIFDVSGRRVATLVDAVLDAGCHTSTFAPRSLPSGVYLVRLEAEGRVATRRSILVR